MYTQHLGQLSLLFSLGLSEKSVRRKEQKKPKKVREE